MQAAAKIITCDAEAAQFWLTPAQADVLVHEHGKDASPYFFVGELGLRCKGAGADGVQAHPSVLARTCARLHLTLWATTSAHLPVLLQTA